MKDCPSCGPYCRCDPTESRAPISGTVYGNANLELTGTTPISIHLHTDGTLTWEPHYETFAPKEGTE